MKEISIQPQIGQGLENIMEEYKTQNKETLSSGQDQAITSTSAWTSSAPDQASSSFTTRAVSYEAPTLSESYWQLVVAGRGGVILRVWPLVSAVAPVASPAPMHTRSALTGLSGR